MTKKILLSMLMAIIFSTLVIYFKDQLQDIYGTILSILNIIGSIFIRLLKFIIVPIVIFSLINGIINLESVNQLKSLGFKTIAVFITTTVIALFLAINTANFFNAGKDFSSNEAVLAKAKAVTNANPPSMIDNIITLVPDNIVSPMLSTNMLQIVIMAIFVGIAILVLPTTQRHGIADSVNKLEQIAAGIINMIMALAPYAIFALLSKTIITQGLDIIWAMAQYALLMLLILIIHVIIIYLPLLKLSGVKILHFFKLATPSMAVAFSTASSNATLPVNLKVANELKVPKAVAGFVLPLGSTLHMNGTAIMQGLAIVFLANIYGIELTLWQYIGAGFLALIATIGAAGIPGTGLVTLTIILIQYNIPIEGIGIIIGIDRIMDMIRTTVNVIGDLIVSLLLSKKERSSM